MRCGGRARSCLRPSRSRSSVFALMPLRSRMLPARAAASSCVERVDAGLAPQLAGRARPEARAPGAASPPTAARRAAAARSSAGGPCRPARRASRRWPCRRRAAEAACRAGRPRDDRLRRVGDRLGAAAVRADLERQLALDLEHVADLVEDARQLVVAQQRHVVAARGSRPRLVRRLIGIDARSLLPARAPASRPQCASVRRCAWAGAAPIFVLGSLPAA